MNDFGNNSYKQLKHVMHERVNTIIERANLKNGRIAQLDDTIKLMQQ